MSDGRWPVPASWCWTKAADVAKIVGGGTPSTKDDRNFADEGIPWIGPADLTHHEGVYIARGRRDLSDDGYAKSGASLMPKGTVLFSSRAPIGHCAIAANPISTNQGFKSWVCAEGVLPEYVFQYLRSSVAYIDSFASGTTFREISGSKMEGVAFPLPPLAEQRRIVAKLDTLTARLRRARTELDRIAAIGGGAGKELKLIDRLEAAILARAFRGELVPQDTTDEPAATLLARIRADRAAAPNAKRGRRAREAADA